jgi:hypothetical protein
MHQLAPGHAGGVAVFNASALRPGKLIRDLLVGINPGAILYFYDSIAIKPGIFILENPERHRVQPLRHAGPLYRQSINLLITGIAYAQH